MAGIGFRRPPPFPFRELARVLLIPLIAVAIFVVFFLRQPRESAQGDEEGLRRITLLQKDVNFQPVSPSDGGASGSVWYNPSGPLLSFQLQAEGLEPGKRYLVEIAVDEVIYTLASRGASRSGELALDTTLTRFAEGVCVGPNYDPPRPLDGRHALRFWVKKDGNPSAGDGRAHAPQFTEGQHLPCSGNGDGDYTYILFENEVADYAGPGAPAATDAIESGGPGPGQAETPRVKPTRGLRGVAAGIPRA